MLACEAFKDASTDWFAEFTANRMRSAKVTIVTITVVDSSFAVGDAASLPDCCADDELLGEIADTSNVKAAKHTHVFDCCSEASKCE